MADDAKTLADLKKIRSEMGYDSWGESWDGTMADAIALIKRQAADNARLVAEIERLTPKEMTLNEVARVLTVHRHRDLTWRAYGSGVEGTNKFVLVNFNGLEARAIANEYARRDAGPIAAPLEPDATASRKESE
ncbi:MAG: hypothetical protein P4L67_04285 [Candidatus Pacebacteria bacterium]|nr:hypothetical protein [Candidatus Paceibacterota bacterium]